MSCRRPAVHAACTCQRSCSAALKPALQNCQTLTSPMFQRCSALVARMPTQLLRSTIVTSCTDPEFENPEAHLSVRHADAAYCIQCLLESLSGDVTAVDMGPVEQSDSQVPAAVSKGQQHMAKILSHASPLVGRCLSMTIVCPESPWDACCCLIYATASSTSPSSQVTC